MESIYGEKGATNWWKNPERGKVSQTRLLLQFSLLMLADAAATGHNIIQGSDFN
jgi:hypothetical protein